MKRIRVAHVITRLCRGGAQENTFHTVRLLRGYDDFEVDLISGPTEGPEGSIEPKIADSGISIHRSPHLIRPAHPRHDLAALNHLTRLFRENGYDIVHTHTSKAGFLGRWAAHRARVPIIVHTPHGHVFDGYFRRPITRLYIHLERHAARWTDRIIALTSDEIDTNLAHGIGHRGQYTVIPSGIDLAPFDQAASRRIETRARLGLTADDFVIGAIGRLEPIKGFEYLIRAMPRILEHRPDAVVLIVGQGSCQDALRAEAKALGDRVQFLGYREDIPEIAAALDVLVVPSRNEGMGRVVVEAGAAGVPAIAAAVGGLPHVIDHETTGLLVPAHDPGALAAAVLDMARDPERRRMMGEAARAKMNPDYSVESMVHQIATLYRELLATKGTNGLPPEGKAREER